MKTIKFSLLLSLIFSLAFVACKKDDDSKDDPTPSSEVSTKDFITIENAVFNNGSLPQGSVNLIKDLTINSTVINGGSTIVSFYSSEKVKTAFVSIKGMDGYYKYDFSESGENLRSTSLYYYELILHIAQELTEQGLTISISCLTEDGVTSAPENTDEIQVKEVGTGKLQVSLSWDQLDDVDLHLLEPSGNKIYYGNRMGGSLEENLKLQFDLYCYLVNKYTSNDVSSLNYDNPDDWDTLNLYLFDLDLLADPIKYEQEVLAFYEGKIDGGLLDLDSNAGCDIDAVNNENITYENAPALGIYYVAVDLFDKCEMSKPGAKYSISVNYNGNLVTISDKQSGQFEADDNGSGDHSERYHIIGAFEITASGITPVAVTNNPFLNYIEYDFDYEDEDEISLRKGAIKSKTKLFKNKKK